MDTLPRSLVIFLLLCCVASPADISSSFSVSEWISQEPIPSGSEVPVPTVAPVPRGSDAPVSSEAPVSPGSEAPAPSGAPAPPGSEAPVPTGEEPTLNSNQPNPENPTAATGHQETVAPASIATQGQETVETGSSSTTMAAPTTTRAPPQPFDVPYTYAAFDRDCENGNDTIDFCTYDLVSPTIGEALLQNVSGELDTHNNDLQDVQVQEGDLNENVTSYTEEFDNKLKAILGDINAAIEEIKALNSQLDALNSALAGVQTASSNAQYAIADAIEKNPCYSSCEMQKPTTPAGKTGEVTGAATEQPGTGAVVTEQPPATEPSAKQPQTPATEPSAEQPQTPATEPSAEQPQSPATEPSAAQPPNPAEQSVESSLAIVSSLSNEVPEILSTAAPVP